jgi:hypothetical protein
MAARTAERDPESVLHLIREDAEASLCGIPRPSLARGESLDDLVCDDCLEWFERRRDLSKRLRTIPRS